MRIIGLAGWSGSGKTTLLAKVIPRLVARGVTVSTIKHAHHSFDVDQPGKDSHTHRMSGATEVLVSSSVRFALVHELRGAPELSLAELVAHLAPVDLLIIEGFKRDAHPKIEVYRKDNGKPPMFAEDPYIFAIASNDPITGAHVPVMPLDNTDAIADVMLAKAAAATSLGSKMRGA